MRAVQPEASVDLLSPGIPTKALYDFQASLREQATDYLLELVPAALRLYIIIV